MLIIKNYIMVMVKIEPLANSKSISGGRELYKYLKRRTGAFSFNVHMKMSRAFLIETIAASNFLIFSSKSIAM